MKAWLRKHILALIGREIEDIARRAYDDGCYVTSKRLQAEKALEFMQITKQNEKLTEMLIERARITMPHITTPLDKPSLDQG